MKKELSRYGLGAIDANTLPGLLRNMLRIRMFEEKIVELYPEQEMKCPVHLCIGQEAIAAGVAAHLKKEDYVFSNHRGHGHCLAKGSSMKPLFAEFYGKATGGSKGKGGIFNLVFTWKRAIQSLIIFADSMIIKNAVPMTPRSYMLSEPVKLRLSFPACLIKNLQNRFLFCRRDAHTFIFDDPRLFPRYVR